MVDVEYDLKQAVLYDSFNPLERFFDLLPIENPESLLPRSMEYTPCKHAMELGAALGMPRLYLKNETVLPTRTTKDRMAIVSLAFLCESGVRSFCTSSTGNSSSSYAHEITRHSGMKMFLFTAEDFWSRVNYEPSDQVLPFVLRRASFVDAFQYAAEFAKENGVTSERGFFNPGRREGLKLAFLEATEQVPHPIDWYVQAVSSGMGVYGAYKGANELYRMGKISRLPSLLCVQQETCAPMVRAFEDGSPVIRKSDVVHNPTGIAEAILRGDPTRAYPCIRRIVMESNGKITAVSEQQIREARKMLEDLEDISACFSASTALAGVIKLARTGKLNWQDTVLVNITGGDRPHDESLRKAQWLERVGETWRT
ncbi:pyridoxal-phosphate dependent enzyme [bacterium]|nr:pyridoxal-phosphate dependent enzyme [bacterium]MCI0605613.1 pyridoxal-phosphate dependent enzyme [bacterium]